MKWLNVLKVQLGKIAEYKPIWPVGLLFIQSYFQMRCQAIN